MDYELQELLSQIKIALDLQSEFLKAGVELWEIRENVDVELARDMFFVGPIGFCERMKFCETVDDFVSTMAEMSLSRKVMEVSLFRSHDDPLLDFFPPNPFLIFAIFFSKSSTSTSIVSLRFLDCLISAS